MANPTRVSNYKYEFCNSGTFHSFDPNRMVYDNSNGGAKMSLLDLHLELVRNANSPDVFIVDARGFIIDSRTGIPTTTTFHRPSTRETHGKRHRKN